MNVKGLNKPQEWRNCMKVSILRTMKTVYNSKIFEMKKIDCNIPLPL